ncbi:hypothetical protein [Amycolatopsis kentuckyensis]|uniref:hypothetical protein n=1 Tax=Amycolatopsis kentuckyensis TaxID=218823 RepID=UPI003565FB91
MTTTGAMWRRVIAEQRAKLDETNWRLQNDTWGIEHSPSLVGTTLVERAAGLAYRVKMTAGFGDELVTMSCRHALVLDQEGMLAEPGHQERVAAVLALVSDPATRNLSGVVVADKVRALLEESAPEGTLW